MPNSEAGSSDSIGASTLSSRLHGAVEGLPDGASVTLPVDIVRDWLKAEGRPTDEVPEEPPEPEEPDPVPTWRERLWVVPADTRIGVVELGDALNVSRSWIYSRTRKEAEDPLPCRKLGDSLYFRVGEIRTWIREHEEVMYALPSSARPDLERIG